MILDLSDDEAAALGRHLRHALDFDPCPPAPRLTPLKAILAKQPGGRLALAVL
jgi:hypothetical protein